MTLCFGRPHLLVAHCVAGSRSIDVRCSRAHCASTVVLGLSINVRGENISHHMSTRPSVWTSHSRASSMSIAGVVGPARATKLRWSLEVPDRTSIALTCQGGQRTP